MKKERRHSGERPGKRHRSRPPPFPLQGELPEPALKGRKAELVIWTTTPWTLPANLAISVHPEVEYVAYELGSRIIVVAKDLLSAFLAVGHSA